MKSIRASEIGSYLFCARAWWYSRQGDESSNTAEMDSGTQIHLAHGRRVLAAGLLRFLGLVLLLGALALFASFCTSRLI